MTRSTDWQTIAERAQEMQLRFMIDLALANHIVVRVTTKMDV